MPPSCLSNAVVELFGLPASPARKAALARAVKSQRCPFLGKKCIKVRKSQPEISIGTCTVRYGSERKPILICPVRLLERRQVFTDSLHLLTLHEPGNELHVVREVTVPGGNVDFFLVSARKRKPVDFVGVELQTLDRTGTVWPARERFLASIGLRGERRAAASAKSFGMNWKMTAKTTFVQLHHKVKTFEHLSKHLVLVIQDSFLSYVRREFSMAHMTTARIGHTMHFHAYSFEEKRAGGSLFMAERRSTDAEGIAIALGLKAETKVGLPLILAQLEDKLSEKTLWTPA